MRGFEDNTLGPCQKVSILSDYCQPLGGAFKVLGTAELILPTPFAKDSDSVRISAFLDVGNVHKSFGDFKADELRASTGLALQWQAPVGPITINIARPLRKKDGDKTESIQFSFGTQF